MENSFGLSKPATQSSHRRSVEHHTHLAQGASRTIVGFFEHWILTMYVTPPSRSEVVLPLPTANHMAMSMFPLWANRD
jgi:hypothetical protein